MANRVRRSVLGLTLVCCAFPGHSESYRGDSWAQVLAAKQGAITVLYRPVAPWAMVDDRGKLVGFEIELFEYFLNHLRSTHHVALEVSWVPEGEFGKLYRRVRESSGGVFGLSKVTILDSRRSEVGFGPPYLNNLPVLVTHESVGDLSSFEELKVFTALTVRGTSMEKELRALASRQLPGLEIQYLDRSSAICERIAADPRSFAVLDLMAVWQNLSTMPIRRQPLAASEPESYGIIVPLGSDWLVPLVEFFEGSEGRLRSTPTYYRLLQRYFGKEIAEIVREVGID